MKKTEETQSDATVAVAYVESAEPSLYSLEEYRQIRKVKAGRVAGFLVWEGRDTNSKTIGDWDKAFEAFNSRKINK